MLTLAAARRTGRDLSVSPFLICFRISLSVASDTALLADDNDFRNATSAL